MRLKTWGWNALASGSAALMFYRTPRHSASRRPGGRCSAEKHGQRLESAMALQITMGHEPGILEVAVCRLPSRARIKARFTELFKYSLIFELCALVSIGCGFGHCGVHHAAATNGSSAPAGPSPHPTDAPSPPPKKRKGGRKTGNELVASFITAHIAKHGRLPTGRALIGRFPQFHGPGSTRIEPTSHVQRRVQSSSP
jgi:hypothetical protein